MELRLFSRSNGSLVSTKLISDATNGTLDLSLFFEQSIFTLLPALVFLLLFPTRLFYLARKDARTCRSVLRVAKLGSAFGFAAVQLAILVAWTQNEAIRTHWSVPAAVLNLVVAVLLIVLTWAEDSRSVRPSTLLNIYLLFTLLLDLPQVRTLWQDSSYTVLASLLTASVAVKAALLILEALEKRAYLKTQYSHLPPESTTGILNRSFMWWMNGLLRKGFRSALTADDLFPLDDALSSSVLERKLVGAWETRRRPERRVEYLIVACRALVGPLLWAALPRALLIPLTFAQPLLIEKILVHLSQTPNEQHPTRDSYTLIGATVFVYIFLAVFNLHYKQSISRFLTMLRGSTITLIYNHTLTVQQGSDDDLAPVTLMSTDVDNMVDSMTEIHEIWARSIEVAIGVVLLTLQVGWVSIMPLAIVIVSFFGVRRISKVIGGEQKIWADAVQKRIATTTSMLTEMRSVKMLGLSERFTHLIEALRTEEIQKMAQYRWLVVWKNVIHNLPWALAPSFTFVVYAGYAAATGNASIDITTAFTSLSIIILMTDTAAKLLSTVPNIAASLGSVDRIQKFLTMPSREDFRTIRGKRQIQGHAQAIEEGSLTIIDSTENNSEPAIIIEQASVRPTAKADIVLKEVSLQVLQGEIVMVVGPVGSGKSILLSTILGEVVLEHGSVAINSQSLAYCPQNAWLPNGTIREIITGHRTATDFDTEWYETVLKACALDQDLSILRLGDETKVGSGSTVLSGGQKQRVVLARAVYTRRDIVILDDILSALDRGTRMIIQEKLFGKTGLFKRLHSTVILATHATECLPLADKIVMLSEGCLKLEDTYENLSRSGILRQMKETIEDTKAPDVPSKVTSADAQASQVAEKNELNDLNRKTGDLADYKYYFDSIGWRKALTFVFFAASQVFALSFSQIWLKWWADVDGTHIATYASFYLMLGFMNSGGIAGYAWSMLIQITPKSARILHSILLRVVMGAPQSFFSATEVGSILNRFSQDMTLIETHLPTGSLVTITNILEAGAGAALIATGSTYMAFTLPALILVIYMLQHVYLRTSRQLRLLDLENKSPLYSHFIETLAGLSTIRAFEWEEKCKEHTRTTLDYSQQPYYLMYCIQGWLNLVLDLVVAAEAILVVTLALSLRSSTTPGFLGVSLNNILSFNYGLASVVLGWTQLETSLGAISRIRTFEIEVQPEHKPCEVNEPPEQWPLHGGITFDNVTASHDPSSIAIKNVSLDIKSGQRVGICGRTGSGKSSLLGTVLRLLEINNGAIAIDGLDIAFLPRDTIRARLTTIPQEPLIVIGTVRLNLELDHIHSDAEIIAALARVGLWTLVEERGGLDTTITPTSFSQGQRQLFALARAILKKSKILLLDEPTSNVDAETDAVMQLVLREEFANSTVLTVAHRLETIYPDSDVIVVMDEGAISEVGSPEDLIARNGRFARMVR